MAGNEEEDFSSAHRGNARIRREADAASWQLESGNIRKVRRGQGLSLFMIFQSP